METETKKMCPLRGLATTDQITGKSGYADLNCVKENCAFWVEVGSDPLIYYQGCAIAVIAHYLTKGGL